MTMEPLHDRVLWCLPSWCRSHCFSFLCSVWFVIPYVTVLSTCFALIFRLLLQSVAFWSVVVCSIYGYTWYTINHRLKAEYPTKKAKILRTKTIPSTPHPQIEPKTFCWVEYLDDSSDTPAMTEAPPLVVQPTTTQKSDEEALEDFRESRNELVKDLKAWAHVPCVLVTGNRDWKTDDVFEVQLVDGDSMRPIYRPFLIENRDSTKTSIRKILVWTVVSLVLLYVWFGGAIITWNSESLENTINGNIEWFFGGFLGLPDDDGDGDIDQDPEKDCSITPYTVASYNFLVAAQMALPLLGVAYFLYKKKTLVGLEEPSAESYQLLRGDEDMKDTNEADSSPVPTASQGQSFKPEIV